MPENRFEDRLPGETDAQYMARQRLGPMHAAMTGRPLDAYGPARAETRPLPDPSEDRSVGAAEVSKAEAEAAVEVLLRYLGQDPGRAGLVGTPRRVCAALREMTQGYREDAAQILGTTFTESYDEVVVLRGVAFTSLCEHHLLPFVGTVDLGYLPGKVVGLSKLARLVECYGRRLQMQERLTRELAHALDRHLQARGVGVVVRASHACMACRGVKKSGAEMVTSCMLGAFRAEPEARAELLSLFRG